MNSLTKYQSNGIIPTEAKDAVAFWDSSAAQFGRGMVACQVMCGFALLELHEQAGIKAGGDQKSGSKPNVFGFDSWAEFVEQTYQFSDDTARSRMDMARKVKSDFKKLGLAERFRSLLSTPPSQWNEEDTKLISDNLQKVTDGMTQTDFLRKLGLAKKPSGNPNAAGKGSRKLTTEEQRLKAVELALEDSGMMGKWVAASNHSFMLTAAEHDVEINAQIAVLEFALKVRRKYLAVPRAQRGEALVREIQKMVNQDSPLMA